VSTDRFQIDVYVSMHEQLRQMNPPPNSIFVSQTRERVRPPPRFLRLGVPNAELMLVVVGLSLLNNAYAFIRPS
jgi:hypothetical protein